MPCPCGLPRDLSACCGRYLAGAAAPTAEALMRSRYTAYATGDLDHIERTCAGPAAAGFDRAELAASQLGTEWLGLEIRAIRRGSDADSEGTVSFVARYRHAGRDGAVEETSRFVRIDGSWCYAEAEFPVAASAARPGRNDPCPCGSGSKYKKCCGA
ncbi:SEC-C motif-containing protein [Hoeflea marina]|uniref:SEC-C motif-containing protein n=1 Tax=Hoeflea marina TaxID=274592 RepID=A0A317PHW9_9HYPH|nr:YchJ family metal-binding protein [Hoeflea marina]PWV99182.1 SEC-C motif-containing protein [Hoeflea marina]